MRKIWIWLTTHRLLILGILASVLLILALALRLATPAQKIAKKVTIQNRFETVKNLDFRETRIVKAPEFSAPQLPPSLPVYAASPLAVPADSLLKNFTAPETINENIWTDSGSKKTLSYNPYGKEYIYNDAGFSGSFDLSLIQSVTLNKAVTVASEYLKSLGILGYTPQTEIVQYYKKMRTGDQGEPLEDHSQANYVTIPFTLNLAGFPLFMQQNPDYPILISVDSADRVIYAKFVATLVTLGKDTQVKTVTLDAALQHLELARILRISTNDAVGFDFNSVQTFTLQRAQIEYRSSDTNPVLIPWYNIQALATVTTNQPPITIDFLLPAVPLEVLAN